MTNINSNSTISRLVKLVEQKESQIHKYLAHLKSKQHNRDRDREQLLISMPSKREIEE